MKNTKKIFFALVGIISFCILAVIIFSIFGILSDYWHAGGDISEIIAPLIIAPLILLIIIGVVCLIGYFVFNDAKKRGMDPWLWTIIVIFVPNLIGLIIYLITRNSNTKKTCANCGKPVDENFMNCPFCGNKLKRNCPSCGEPVAHEWNTCPKCGEKLK